MAFWHDEEKDKKEDKDNPLDDAANGDYFQKERPGRLTGRDFSPFDFPFEAFEFSEYDKATIPTLKMKSPWEFAIEDGKPITAAIRELDREYLPTSNHNVHIFYQDTAPTSGVYYGDIWIDSSDGNKSHKYADNNGAYYGTMGWRETPQTLLMSWAEDNISSEKYIWFKKTEPSGTYVGDYWFDTDGQNNLYEFDGSSWGLSSMDRASQGDLWSHVGDHFDLSYQWDYSAVAPVGLTVLQYQQGLKLWWSMSPLARSVRNFLIERAKGSDPADGDFSQIATTEDRTFVDTPDFDTGSDGEPVATTFTYRVKSQSWTLDISVPSNEASATLNPDLQGAVQIGSVIQSSGYVADSSGWQITGDGDAEFNNVTVRGTVEADTGHVGTWIISDTSLQSDVDGNARVELNPVDNRVEIWDSTGEKVAMGYLGGLSDPADRTTDLSSSTYGFWTAEGDSIEVNGNFTVKNGQYQLEDDASLTVISTSTGNPVLVFGTVGGVKGVHFYESGTLKETIKWDSANDYLNFNNDVAINGGLSAGDGLMVVAGAEGPEGPEGPAGDEPAHEWSDTSLRFENPDGTWGSYTDLEGDPGVLAPWSSSDTPYPQDSWVTHNHYVWVAQADTSEEPSDASTDWKKVKLATAADEFPLGTISFWDKSLEAKIQTVRSTGTADSDSDSKLIDSSATFSTDGVIADDIVWNTTDDVPATVISVDSETQITLDYDAFPDGNEGYTIYQQPDIQPGWKELDGTVINDPDSPFDGMTVEDVIGKERFFQAKKTAQRLSDNIASSGSNVIKTLSIIPVLKIKNFTQTKLATYYEVNGGDYKDLSQINTFEREDKLPVYDVSDSVYKHLTGNGIEDFLNVDEDVNIANFQFRTDLDSSDPITTNSWTEIPLNTTQYNTINGASLNATNRIITLPSGKYEIDFAQSFMRINDGQIRLYNITTGEVIAYSNVAYTASSSGGLHSGAKTVVELTQTTQIQFQYYIQDDYVDGLGRTPSDLGNVSTYSVNGYVFVKDIESLRGPQGKDGIGVPYDNTVSYDIDEVVNYENVLYRSLQNNNLDNQPDTSPQYWAKITYLGAENIADDICYVGPSSNINISGGVVIPLDSQYKVGSKYTVDTTNNDVEITEDGEYLLHYHITTYINNGSGDRTDSRAELEKSTDGGSTWNLINTTLGGMYNRTGGYDQTSASVLHYEYLNAGDKIRLWATRESGGAGIGAYFRSTAMMILPARGKRGEDGLGIPYSSSKEYYKDQVVLYDNVLYRSRADNNLNNQPNTSPGWWKKVETLGYTEPNYFDSGWFDGADSDDVTQSRAHGLGQVPVHIAVWVREKDGTNEALIYDHSVGGGDNNERQTIGANDTHVFVHLDTDVSGNQFPLYSGTDSSGNNITPDYSYGNYQLRFMAWSKFGGAKGDSPEHQWDGTKLQFEQPDGTWGTYTDLKGDPGYSAIAPSWDSSTTYNTDDIVEHNGQLYVSLVDNNTEEPGTGSNWTTYDNFQHIFNKVWPVGSTYTQYPGKLDPGGLGLPGTWDNISTEFAGDFFRVEDDGTLTQTFDNQTSSQTSQNKAHDHSGSYTDTVGNHGHNIDNGNASSNSSKSRSGKYGGHYDFNSDGSGSHNHDVTVIENGGVEARPQNKTIRIWERVS